MPMRVKSTVNKAALNLQKTNSTLDGLSVQWGLTEESADYPDGTSVHMVGAVHEFGIGVPVRDWLTQNFLKRTPELITLAEIMEDAAFLRGENSDQIQQRAKLIGQKAASDLARDLTLLTFEPLSQLTIDRKGQDTPLIETGHMKSQIKWSVEII